MTKYPDIFAGLNAKFADGEIKTRPQGNQKLSYVTARVVMNRLDDVLGPENWWDEYFPMEHSVLCKLSIRLPDGSVLCKSDAGGYAGMTDQGDDDKSGFSDAFKRAAVKFGVGRYLYRDGVPSFKAAPEITPRQAKPHPVEPATKPAPRPAVNFQTWVKFTCEEINKKWVDELTRNHGGRMTSAPAEVINPFKLGNHLLKWARAGGIVSPTETTAEAAYARDSVPFAEEALAYCRKEWLVTKRNIKPQREPGDDPTEDEHAALDRLVAEGKVPA